MDWMRGSSGRAPALQMQSSEFKLQSHQKKKKKSNELKKTFIESVMVKVLFHI
jgi:hypothetical protein